MREGGKKQKKQKFLLSSLETVYHRIFFLLGSRGKEYEKKKNGMRMRDEKKFEKTRRKETERSE